MATARKKRGRWYARYKGADGLWHECAVPARTAAQAERLSHELELREWRIREGLQAQPSTETVEAASVRYLAAIQDHKSIGAIRSRWKQHILPALGATPAQQVKPTQVEALLAQMKRDGYAEWTRRHVRTTLSAFYEWLQKDGVVDANPIAKVDAVAKPKPQPKARPLEELQAIADAATFPGLRYLVLLLFYTGSRPGAMLNVRKQHVRLEPPAQLHFPEVKGGKPHAVNLPPQAAALLQDLMHATPGQHLFLNKSGKPLTLRHADRAFKVALKRAGVVVGWEARCRRKGCGYVEARKPGEGERCPRCKFVLWATAIPAAFCLKDLRSSSATHIVEHLPAELGVRAAGAHLGHAPGSSVTEQHYVAPPRPSPLADAITRAFTPTEPTHH